MKIKSQRCIQLTHQMRESVIMLQTVLLFTSIFLIAVKPSMLQPMNHIYRFQEDTEVI